LISNYLSSPDLIFKYLHGLLSCRHWASNLMNATTKFLNQAIEPARANVDENGRPFGALALYAQRAKLGGGRQE